MTRRLFNLLTLLSLLLCFAAAAMWARGYMTGDVVRYITGGTSRSDQTIWAVANGGGGIAFVVVRGSGSDVGSSDDGEPLGFHWREVTPRYAGGRWPGDSRWNRAGFYWFYERGNSYAGRMGMHGFIAPSWALCLVAAALPAIAGIGYVRRRRRYVRGTCKGCGYDLRGTPGRCPECGIVSTGTVQ